MPAIVAQIGIMGDTIRSKVNKLQSYSLFESKRSVGKESSGDAIKPIILKTSKLGKLSETPDGLVEETSKPRKKSIRINERDDNIKPCVEYFRLLEHERNHKSKEIQKIYDSIGPIMIKLESLILGSFTGESEKMSNYYTHWEKEMFSALMRFTTRNLQEFTDKLMSDDVLFEVDAVLTAPEINMKPSVNEIHNILVHSVKDFLER